jgi:hypothetical protein
VIKVSLELLKIVSKFTKLALGSVLCNKLVTLVLPDANNYTKSNNTQEV